MLLPEIGDSGQRRLNDASAVVIGVGALGSVSAELLVRAGVGRVVLVDRDVVELTNLQRQTLFAERDVGQPKAQAAARRLRSINGDVRVEPRAMDLDGLTAQDLVAGTDVLIDGTDNFETRYVINDAAIAAGIPAVFGGAVGVRGTVVPVVPGGPCLRCIAEEVPSGTDTCDTVGVFGPLIHLVAARQAAIGLRILLGLPVDARLESVDAMTGEWRRLDLSAARDDSCVCCGQRRFEFLSGSAGGRAVPMCGRASVHVTPASQRGIDLSAVEGALSPYGRFAATEGLVRGEFAEEQGDGGAAIGMMVFGDGRAIVTGTTDPARARSIYAKYVGG